MSTQLDTPTRADKMKVRGSGNGERNRSHNRPEASTAEGTVTQPINAASSDFNRSAAHLAAIVESSDDAILSKLLDGTITSWNHAAELLYGYEADEIVGRPVTVLMPPERQNEFKEIMGALSRGERIQHYRTERQRKDGSRIQVSLTISPIHDHSGKVVGASTIARDLTMQLQLEAELKKHAEQQAVVARPGLMAFQEDDLQVIMNEAVRETARVLGVEMCKILELCPDHKSLLLVAGVGWHDDLIGKAEVGAGLDSQAGATLLSREPIIIKDLKTDTRFSEPELLHEQGVVSGISVVIPGAEGPFGVLGAHSRRPHEFTRDDVNFFQAVANLIGGVVQRKRSDARLVALNQSLEHRVAERTAALQLLNAQLNAEIGERSRAENELSKANQALTQRNNELQDFAYIASHDLQEPLRKIRSFAELLVTDFESSIDERGMFYLDRMQDAAARMSRLINDLLTFSRLVTQAQPFEPVDLNEVLDEVLSDLEIRITEVDGTVDVDTLPTIEADSTQMRQLFQNLIGNALKFSVKGRPPVVRVTCETVEVDGQESVRLVFEDNGIGFEQEHAEHIFSPFKRLHSRSEYPGTGMGLAIVRRIVERHNGTITAEGYPGVGSKFIVVLPKRHEKSDG